MYEKMMQIKKDKKWLFYLLIVPFVLIFIYEMYGRYLIGSTKKAIKKVENKDSKLKKEQKELLQESKQYEDKASKIEEDIKNINVDKDWHKK